MEAQPYDIVIVGGGIAGGALASKVANEGKRVLVLELATTFRDRVRGEWLAPWGVAEARLLGLESAFSAAGAHPLPMLAGRSGKARPVVSPAGDSPLSFFHPALQEAILIAAAKAGASIVRGARVTGVGGGAPAEVEYTEPDGLKRTVTARLVVGADGRQSLVRQALGKPQQVHRSDRLLAGVRLGGVTGDPSIGYFIIREDAGGLVSLFPQGDGYARGYVFLPGADTARFTGAGAFERFVSASVDLGVPAEVLASAFPAGPLASFVASDTWVESPAGNGLALVGDAAGISDPTWGMGMSIALRDARTLAEALQGTSDWESALALWMHERDRYFRTIVTAENWQTELQLASGADATARRKHALGQWSQDPSRALDLPGKGPDLDVSESARQRFFAEDVPVATERARESIPVPAADSPDPPGPRDLAGRFIKSLSARDFGALEQCFSPTMRMRALLPGGPVELHGSARSLAAFIGWFQDVDDFSVVGSGQSQVADRLEISWHFKLRWPGESITREIRQVGYAKVIGGQIAVLDLLCSGFRPQSQAA